MTAHHFVKITVVSTLALAAAGCVTVAAVPMLRHYLVALFNDPRDLPVLERDWRVHFEPEARACALDVAELLPAALARVEAAQQVPSRAARQSASMPPTRITRGRTDSKTPPSPPCSDPGASSCHQRCVEPSVQSFAAF